MIPPMTAWKTGLIIAGCFVDGNGRRSELY